MTSVWAGYSGKKGLGHACEGSFLLMTILCLRLQLDSVLYNVIFRSSACCRHDAPPPQPLLACGWHVITALSKHMILCDCCLP